MASEALKWLAGTLAAVGTLIGSAIGIFLTAWRVSERIGGVAETVATLDERSESQGQRMDRMEADIRVIRDVVTPTKARP